MGDFSLRSSLRHFPSFKNTRLSATNHPRSQLGELRRLPVSLASSRHHILNKTNSQKVDSAALDLLRAIWSIFGMRFGGQLGVPLEQRAHSRRMGPCGCTKSRLGHILEPLSTLELSSLRTSRTGGQEQPIGDTPNYNQVNLFYATTSAATPHPSEAAASTTTHGHAPALHQQSSKLVYMQIGDKFIYAFTALGVLLLYKHKHDMMIVTARSPRTHSSYVNVDEERCA